MSLKIWGGRGEFKHMFYAYTIHRLLIWWVLNPIFFQSRFSECGMNSSQFPFCEYALGWIPVSSPSGCGVFPEELGALSWPESPRVLQVEGSHSSVPRGDMGKPPLRTDSCPVCNIHVPTASRPRHRGLAWPQIQRASRSCGLQKCMLMVSLVLLYLGVVMPAHGAPQANSSGNTY